MKLRRDSWHYRFINYMHYAPPEIEANNLAEYLWLLFKCFLAAMLVTIVLPPVLLGIFYFIVIVPIQYWIYNYTFIDSNEILIGSFLMWLIFSISIIVRFLSNKEIEWEWE